MRLGPIPPHKKANIPTLGPRFLVKFPRMGKAIEVKSPTSARGPPPPPSSGLTLIDALQIQFWLSLFLEVRLKSVELLICLQYATYTTATHVLLFRDERNYNDIEISHSMASSKEDLKKDCH